jgi:hypothetical protein
LLLLSEREGKIAGALMPFAAKDFPRNTATIFNMTDCPLFSPPVALKHADLSIAPIPVSAAHRNAFGLNEMTPSEFAVRVRLTT